jgi:hypothetical protein
VQWHSRFPGSKWVELTANPALVFAPYVCSNCRSSRTIFALYVEREGALLLDGVVFKFGEGPTYGPPTPNRLLKLFKSDRELFLKGRRCEHQGLGIGAFTYYRRVVESHKDRLFDEIIKVARTVGAPEPMLTALADAKKEISFKKALQSVKDAIPVTLLIKGHNPLTLLHKALNSGEHEMPTRSALPGRTMSASCSPNLLIALPKPSKMKPISMRRSIG